MGRLNSAGILNWLSQLPGAEQVQRCLQEPRVRWLAIFIVGWTLLLAFKLVPLIGYALQHKLHSHIVLIPLVSAYLLYSDRAKFSGLLSTDRLRAGIAGGVAVLALVLGFALPDLSRNDHLAWITGAYLAGIIAGGFVCLGRGWMRQAWFPLAFLIFMIPMPDGVALALEKGLMVCSAQAAAPLFSLGGIPFIREGQVFELPGVILEVAEECSGIRSTWVLLIVSVLAARILLTSPWRQALLVIAVIPLGILRNAFRIAFLGKLCVDHGPQMLDSPLHRQGGPVFFLMSLVPLFAFGWLLRKTETRDQI